MNVWLWIKKNKLAALLLLILAIIIGKSLLGNFRQVQPLTSYRESAPMAISDSYNSNSAKQYMAPGIGGGTDIAPAPEVADRMVIQESRVSLLVKNVPETTDKISEYARNEGGYMVTSNVYNKEEAPTGNITIRIPSKNIRKALDFLATLSVRVVSENLSGEDVTDQYVDIEARLATLNKTKLKFEEIMEKAVKVEDILNVQREIINIQSQIDSLKGQQQYLAKSAQMAKITVYLSTDELALPYAPSEAWRPAVIFKTAVRSLVGFGRSIASAVIWIGVYSIIWIPALLIFYFLRKKFYRKV